MSPYGELANILGVGEAMLRRLDEVMTAATGRGGVMEGVVRENRATVERIFGTLGVNGKDREELHGALNAIVLRHEEELLAVLADARGSNELEKAASFSKQLAGVKKGFFLKKDRGEAILRSRPPEYLLKFFGYAGVDDLLKRHDIGEIFSALRFVETDQWMHETFDAAYSEFTPDDFEEREIEVRALGPEWADIAKKFVAKKHHNVSHLKEFGVIFLNPIKEDLPGKLLRDFALLLHYFHEIEFYSELFKRYSGATDTFAERLKKLLRGDVLDGNGVREGDWLIVQRYLFKEDPRDARLFMPRVNPESFHWARAERDLATFVPQNAKAWGLKMWHNSDWVGWLDAAGVLVSFDLEDNAMNAVSSTEEKHEVLGYHQREALWTRLFIDYAGGEGAARTLVFDNFDKGLVRFVL